VVWKPRLVRENVDLFAPPGDSERFQACLDTIREEYVGGIVGDSVLLRDVVAEHGYDQQVLKRAFNRREEECRQTAVSRRPRTRAGGRVVAVAE
jgi:hypothetical protein